MADRTNKINHATKIDMSINVDTNNKSFKNQWRKLRNMNVVKKCRPLCVAHDSIIIIPETIQLSGCKQSIFKYDIKTQQMIPIVDVKFKLIGHDAVYNKRRKTAFICDGDRRIFALNVETMIIKSYKLNDIGCHCRLELGDNDTVHIFGGANNGKQVVFDVNNGKYQKGKKLAKIENASTFATASNIYIFGGEICHQRASRIFDVVSRYSLKDKKWSSVANMNRGRYGAGICRINQRCLCLFGGVVSKIHYGSIFSFGVVRPTLKLTDEILVFDLVNNTFNECSIKCPKKVTFHAVFMNNKYESEILCNGWIKQSFNDQDMRDMSLPPVYIIDIVTRYRVNPYIVLIEAAGKCIYRINCATILDSIK